jgi:hypothetical protein
MVPTLFATSRKKPEVLHVHGQLSSIAQDPNGAYYKVTHKEGCPGIAFLRVEANIL